MYQIRIRWLPVLAGVVLLGVLIGWYAWPSSVAEAALWAPVQQGTFSILVSTTGELRANKFTQITGPAEAQQVGAFQTKIASIVPEGSIVKAGDVIAELDRAPLATHQNDVLLNVQKAQADYTTAELDSALNLSQAREDVRTAEYGLEQKKLLKEEAQYEAPSIKRQAEIDYEIAARALDQSKRNLDTKTRQAIAKISSVGADLTRQQNQLKEIQAVMERFTVKTPASGMVIYVRTWDGNKKGVGSSWAPWDPVVATLPDLTQMESDTYVNEVDIRKIALGQRVQITLDADPSKRLAGTVTEIANVGEQRPNQDSKVFAVKIQIARPDTTLRPGMTTANTIVTASLPNVLSVPIEAVSTDGGVSYVYKKAGGTVIKQMVETGASNDNAIVVRRGLTKNDRVLLSTPSEKTGIKTELIPGHPSVGGLTSAAPMKLKG